MNIGMKAVLNAPSANKRLNMFGKEKATKKASAVGPVPKKFAISMSLMKPKTLLINVHNPTDEKFLIR